MMRKRRIIFVMILMSILIATGCGKTNVIDNQLKGLTAQEAYDRMNSEDPVVILDVRRADEYEESHIPGAILIPNEEIVDSKPALLPVMDAEILIYCRSGNRSRQAAEKLVKMGYTNVSDFGGMIDWPYDTISGEWEEKEGTYASFSTVDLNGEYVDESFFQDKKITMVNVWATFCSPCLQEMPELGELSQEYADKDVQFVGVVLDTMDADANVDQSQVENARQLVEQTGASYTHLLPSRDLLQAGLAEMYYVPTTFFVDSNGSIVGETYVGSKSKEEWTAIIDSVINALEE
ncbi:MAG TPA: rhodanese-like domain-containing protein [Lachnospiraceae bacterium]|nr:rhodanese-like domain-containing protein [Lachnospiraceae bacterium]